MGEQLPILEIKYNIELLALVLHLRNRQFHTREQECEKVPCPLRTWTFTISCLCGRCLAIPELRDETNRKVCALFIFYYWCPVNISKRLKMMTFGTDKPHSPIFHRLSVKNIRLLCMLYETKHLHFLTINLFFRILAF